MVPCHSPLVAKSSRRLLLVVQRYAFYDQKRILCRVMLIRISKPNLFAKRAPLFFFQFRV